jgi:DNA-binding transcriptional ArsR family regulator
MAASRHQHSPPIPDDRLLDDASASDLAERFKLLSDPHRLRIVYALVEGGETCVGAIAELVGSSESATSHQLRNLRLAGFVRSRRHGREVFYSVADSHIRVLLDVAVEHYLHNHEDRP